MSDALISSSKFVVLESLENLVSIVCLKVHFRVPIFQLSGSALSDFQPSKASFVLIQTLGSVSGSRYYTGRHNAPSGFTFQPSGKVASSFQLSGASSVSFHPAGKFSCFFQPLGIVLSSLQIFSIKLS